MAAQQMSPSSHQLHYTSSPSLPLTPNPNRSISVSPVSSLPSRGFYDTSNDSIVGSNRSISYPSINGEEGVANMHLSHQPLATPQLVAIQEMESDIGPPNASPLLVRSGKIVGGVKKFLRIPSSGQGELSAMDGDDTIESTDRNKFQKVLHHIRRHPRVHVPRGLKRHKHHHPHSARRSSRRQYTTSDDGYTSDPGLLRDDNEDEEETTTESGDPETDIKISQRLTQVENKLQNYKKILQEKQEELQAVENEYVQGMEISMDDKAQQKIRDRFISKQSDAKKTIEHLNKKVTKYEERLQLIKQSSMGENVDLTGTPATNGSRYGNKVRTRLNRITRLDEVKSGLKGMRRLRPKKKAHTDTETVPSHDDEEEMFEDPSLHDEAVLDVLDDEFVEVAQSKEHMSLKDDDNTCGYCLNEYHTLTNTLQQQKEMISTLSSQCSIMYEKLHAEREKTDRLENELNTLTDLHQHEVIELRGQLAQMERLTFSKSQDLEDNIESCLARLHKLEVAVDRNDHVETKELNVGFVRKFIVAMLTFLLQLAAFCFKLSEHLGKKAAITILILLISIVFYFIYSSS